MKRSLHWLWLSLFLIGLGGGLFLYRGLILDYPLLPDTDAATWTLQARLQIVPEGGPIKVRALLPEVTPGFTVLDENFVSRGFGLTIEDEGDDRLAQWAVRRERGSQPLYYRAVVYRDRTSRGLSGTPPFPEPPTLEEPFATAMRSLVNEVREQSADIASFAAEVVSRLNDPSPGEQTELLAEGARTSIQKARLAQRILASARIPSEILHGIHLSEEMRDAQLDVMLAVHNGQEWLYFDLGTGQRGLPRTFFVWWVGDRPMAQASGADLSDIRFSVRRNQIDALQLAHLSASDKRSALASYSLLNLPVQTQTAYTVLLLVPLGAFVIVVLRNIVGVRTFGTFMPVLIALAFRETQLLAGIVLFTVVTSLGLLIRFYLEHMRLLLVPRLAAVLTVVVLLMTAVGLVSHRLDMEVGLSITLFPMVILAMVIERMSIVWEERGAGESITEGIGSLVVAAMAYVVMGIPLVQHLTFVFPETLLILLGLTIAIGRYTGYRVSELFRFRELQAMTGEQPKVD